MANDGVVTYNLGDDIYIVETWYNPIISSRELRQDLYPIGHPDTLPTRRHRVFISLAGVRAHLSQLKKYTKPTNPWYAPCKFRVYRVKSGTYTEETDQF